MNEFLEALNLESEARERLFWLKSGMRQAIRMGTILKPTIVLDGEVFEEDGVYKHPRVREICRELGVAGY